MKKRLSLLLALVFCLGLVPFASADNSPFSDVPSDHWAYDAVMEKFDKMAEEAGMTVTN